MPSITEKRRSKGKYLTWNSIRLKFVKKTSMPNPVKSLEYIKCYILISPRPVKGNPNFQGILNWIIQILHYYCRKQQKNIENSRIIGQNVAICLCSSLCLLQLTLPSPSSAAGYFQFYWTQFWTSQVIIRAVHNFILYCIVFICHLS